MQLQAASVKIGILGSLIIGLSVSGQALAVDPLDNSVMCAAYMDIAVKDLYPLGAIPPSKAKEMLVGRFTRLASVSLKTKEPASEVVSSFIDAKFIARKNILANSQFNAMRLSPSRDVYAYAKTVDANTKKHCDLSNKELEDVVKSHTRDDIVDRSIAISVELKKRDEK